MEVRSDQRSGNDWTNYGFVALTVPVDQSIVFWLIEKLIYDNLNPFHITVLTTGLSMPVGLSTGWQEAAGRGKSNGDVIFTHLAHPVAHLSLRCKCNRADISPSPEHAFQTGALAA